METFFVYLVKASGLITVFYLAYHFLVRKETFFNSNRWFLITGLLTAVLLPLFSLTKIVYVTPKIDINHLIAPTNEPGQVIQNIAVQPETIDLVSVAGYVYGIIVLLLIGKVIFDLISLARMLRHKEVVKEGNYSLIDSEEAIAPFSFFHYIVYNSSLYSQSELESILLHEKVHSRQQHSVDLLLAKIFCAVFWLNPFVWLYKKSIIQNLEYIADNGAIQHTEDKTSYQKALLKVTASQNCFPVTNHFYQSLIKKRIIMLNQDQSHKRNAWKYTVVLPSLIAFVFLFQIQVEARSRVSIQNNSKSSSATVIQATTPGDPIENAFVFDKISSDNEFEEATTEMKNEFNIDFKASNIKRNSKGEIIAIKLSFDDHKGNKGKTEQNRAIPIRPIFFKFNKTKEGKTIIGFYDNPEMVVKPVDPVNENKITTIESIKDNALIYVDGERYTKEDLNELDPKGLEKIEILTDSKSLEKYNAKDKGEVIVITTNWETKPTPAVQIAQQAKPIVFSLENGDDVVVMNRNIMKVVYYPMVTFSDSSPILIVDGKQQENPRLTLEKMDVTKIKAIKVLNENDQEVKGTPIYKMILTTK